MERVKKNLPQVALSKNHCHYPLFTPATKQIEEIRLPNGVKVKGIGYHNTDGNLQYVISFGNRIPEGHEVKPLSTFDGRILLGLLAQLQKENNRAPKGTPINYTLKVGSFYRLLKMIGIDNHDSSNYVRAREALFKIRNTSLIFSGTYYDPEKKARLDDIVDFEIFKFLKVTDNHYESGRKTDCSITVKFSEDWYAMHSSYFLLHELEWVKKLSEVEYTLACLLEAWSDMKLEQGNVFVRDFRSLCLKIGYKDVSTYDLKRQIANAIKNVNSKCGRDYRITFVKKNIEIMTKKAKVRKRLMTDVANYF